MKSSYFFLNLKYKNPCTQQRPGKKILSTLKHQKKFWRRNFTNLGRRILGPGSLGDFV